MNRLIKNIFTCLLQLLTGGLLLVSCKKYDTQPDMKGAAYLRVFNEIPFTLDLTTKTQVVPFFTMIIDPIFSGKGVPSGGQIVGDYLGSRLVFNPSTSINEGNPLGTPLDTTIRYNINYEYPGNAHVLTAPSINGLDLSAWAQISSGKHRVLFITRPRNKIDFSLLSDTIRNSVIIDTTVDLRAGEVYTMETVLQDIDETKYGIYLRQESFIHETFDRNKNYVTFFNLSGKNSSLSSNPISPSSGYFYDTMNVSYTYYDPQAPGNNLLGAPIPGYTDIYLMTLNSRMAAGAPYLPLPVLPLSSFYDNQGTLKTYYNYSTQNRGTMPYFVFNFIASGNNVPTAGMVQTYSLICDVDPVMVNTLTVYQVNNRNGGGINANANLNMVVQLDGKAAVYPAVYIMELVFNKVYLMQVQQKI
ncbi:MAG: hypothetical protein J0H74_25575 [Chitinophagaceae bacterium]|nr:hypothetical protein [Chitinophagaceae bacterium]